MVFVMMMMVHCMVSVLSFLCPVLVMMIMILWFGSVVVFLLSWFLCPLLGENIQYLALSGMLGGVCCLLGGGVSLQLPSPWLYCISASESESSCFVSMVAVLVGFLWILFV